MTRKTITITITITIAIAAAAAAATAALAIPASAQPATTPTGCTRAYGQCQVTEYIHVRHNGTHWVETCFASQPVTEGHGDVRVAVSYCYRP